MDPDQTRRQITAALIGRLWRQLAQSEGERYPLLSVCMHNERPGLGWAGGRTRYAHRQDTGAVGLACPSMLSGGGREARGWRWLS
ncbi:uncharacterized protein B0I36DRAFT_319230 [Microdochium trichocladiopsis]|uniref:Uncharacterized protein n=1 Tax=Microdochium trichocladiopsis TaxID=1682393 RepID=A0A9P9BRF8_9PEZI|nr:uncharacterized protein B0I36DRAFT_319230 [Microdochium trichocladiopsis]KAH7035863.1 hypothetical protein B0I36DRAFT_319230 [Microdochium trichocladiopsis]